MYFDWTVRTLKEWSEYYKRTHSANWMQTWAYAQASFKVDYLVSRIALIKDQHDIPIGLMCVQSTGLGPFKVINLKRGPLWFAKPSSEVLCEFAVVFRKEFPNSIFQRLRWMPDFNFAVLGSDETIGYLCKIGFKLRQENFLTSWVDLSRSVCDLRKGLQQKWRNCLHKAESKKLIVKGEYTLRNATAFFKYYSNHMKFKNYSGPSVKFLSEEFTELSKTQDIYFLWAFQKERPVAAIAVVFHGTTASYRLGWNTLQGRACNAHYLLLWEAIVYSKSKGLKFFDLGGILPDEAPGISHFKMGIGGEISRTVTFC